MLEIHNLKTVIILTCTNHHAKKGKPDFMIQDSWLLQTKKPWWIKIGLTLPETANNCLPDIHYNQVPKQFTQDEIPVIKVHQPESVIEIDDKDQCDQCIFKSQDSYKLKQHKRHIHRDCSASVTPPPKKRMEPEPRRGRGWNVFEKNGRHEHNGWSDSNKIGK